MLALDEWAQYAHAPASAREAFIARAVRTDEGLSWGASQSLAGYQWCGAFAALALRDRVPVAARRKFMASTYRLWSPSARDAFASVPLDEVAPRDVLVVGSAGGKRWGDHVCVVVGELEPGLWLTAEGNAYGLTAQSGLVTRGATACVLRSRPREATSRACPITGLAQSRVAMFAYRGR